MYYNIEWYRRKQTPRNLNLDNVYIATRLPHIRTSWTTGTTEDDYPLLLHDTHTHTQRV